MKCRSPICWDDVGERRLLGPEIVQQTIDKIQVIKERLQIAQSRQKSYADMASAFPWFVTYGIRTLGWILRH